MKINHGSGGVAKCVLSPPYNCTKKKYDSNYISKISELKLSNLIVLNNEIKISNILNKNKKNKKSLNKYLSLVVDSCNFLNNKKKKISKKCKLKKNVKYNVLYSKNGACKNKITNKCGNLYEVRDVLFNNKNIKKTIHDLLKILLFLNKNKIVHFDIKAENFIVNNNLNIRSIDFGGSLYIDEFKELKTINNFKILLNNIYEKILCWTRGYISPEILIVFEFVTNINIDKESLFEIIVFKLEIKNNNEAKYSLYNLINYIYNDKVNFIKEIFLNEHIYKYDIYSLGVMLYQIIIYKYLSKGIFIKTLDKKYYDYYKKINILDLVILVEYMTKIDYRERYNIHDCLKSRYFK